MANISLCTGSSYLKPIECPSSFKVAKQSHSRLNSIHGEPENLSPSDLNGEPLSHYLQLLFE